MLVRRTDRSISHHHFKDIEKLFNPGDLLVLNNTRVIPARLFGNRTPTGGRVELLFHAHRKDGVVEALTRPAKKLDIGQEISLDGGAYRSRVVGDLGDGIKELEIFKGPARLTEADEIVAFLKEAGQIALPPYVTTKPTPALEAEYQTVYAATDGATAAPTAGLHFTDELLNKLRQKGLRTATVTLHTGMGTFRPITSESVEEHKMHAEWFQVPSATVKAIEQTQTGGHRVIAVGTTTVRSLEFAAKSGKLAARTGEATLFIQPGYQFRVVDALITNFHLPRTTLLAMVMALAGEDLIRRAYAEAIKEKYRLFSFGDAMLIL